MTITYTPPNKWRKLFTVGSLGVVVLIGVLIFSLFQVWSVKQGQVAGGKHVIRISHWQLELGYRQALQGVIERYNALKKEQFEKGLIDHPVEAVQLPVTEKVYPQLINTHMIAGTAPDIIEMGKGKATDGTNKAEYFLSLSEVVAKPNPYNSPQYLTPDVEPELVKALPKLGWRDTFVDGMVGGWDYDLQAQYGVPTCFHSSGRLSYNLDLMKEATGSDQVPRTLGELLTLCKQLREFGVKSGRTVMPIAGSQYSAGFWYNFINPFTATWQSKLDFDHNGQISAQEGFAGLSAGVIKFTDPEFQEFLQATSAVASEFPNGFTAMDREAAMFLFVQGKAGILFTGSWDAATVYKLSKFRVKIAPIPLPGSGEQWADKPKYASSEAATKGGSAYGVYKRSASTADAIDFLQYITSHTENERFNREADWVPCIIGMKPNERMDAFAPRLEGIHPSSGWTPGTNASGAGQIAVAFDGQMNSLLVKEATPESIAVKMAEVYKDPVYGEQRYWVRQIEDNQTRLRALERTIGIQAALPLLRDKAGAGPAAYRALVWNQALNLNGQAFRLLFNQTAGATGKTFPEAQ